MPPAYSYTTDRGTFWILPGIGSLWHIIFDGDDLGAFSSPAVAAAASSRVRLPAALRSLSQLLPTELAGWTKH